MLGDFPLKDKIVLITGGGSGIGLSFSQLALSLGAKVIIADLKLTQPAEELVAENEAAHFVKCDVSNWKDLQNLIAFSEEKFGTVPDVYVPNAGIYEPSWSNFWDDTEDDGYAVVRINVEHPVKLTRIAIRALLKYNKKGVVLLVSSLSGLRSKYGTVLYCTTKHAIVGFVKGMGLSEDLEGVKIVGVCPGRVHTPLWTDRTDLKTNFTCDESQSMAPEDMAAVMADLIQQGKYTGGTVYLAQTGKSEVVFEGIKDPEKSVDAVRPETKRVQGILRKERKGGSAERWG